MPHRERRQKKKRCDKPPTAATAIFHSGSPDGPAIASSRAQIVLSEDIDGQDVTFVQTLDTVTFIGDGKQVFVTYEAPASRKFFMTGPAAALLKSTLVEIAGQERVASNVLRSSESDGQAVLMLSSDRELGTPFQEGVVYRYELGRTMTYVPVQ